MDSTHEIFEGLDSGRPVPRRSGPALVFALGDFGRRCLSRFNESVMEENAGDALVCRFAVVRDGGHGSGIGVVAQPGVTTISLPTRPSRNALSEVIRLERDALRSVFMKAGGSLLDQASEMGQAANRLDVYVFGDAEELEGSVGGIELTLLVREALTGYLAHLDLRVYGLFLLPQGISERGPEVYAFLADLFGIQRDAGWPKDDPGAGAPYDRVYMISPANAAGPLTETGVTDLVAEFLMLSLFADLQATLAQTLDDREATFASYGLATLIHPAERMAALQAGRFAGRLIDRALLAPDDGAGERQADEYVKNQRLDGGTLYDRLIAADRGTLVDQLRVDPLSFRDVPMSLWPDQIASYDGFLQAEAARHQAAKIDDNLRSLLADFRDKLGRRVDEMLSGGASVQSSLAFLDTLKERLLDGGQKVIARKDAHLKTAPRLHEKRNRLTHEIQHLPGLPAIASRFFVGGVLLVYLSQALLTLMRRLPDRYLQPNYLPGSRLVAAAIIAFAAAGGWLTYKRAEARLFRRRQQYAEAVERRHRDVVEKRALDRLIEMLSDGEGSMARIVEEEMGCVRELRRNLVKAHGRLGDARTPSTSTIRQSTDHLLESQLAYKRGQYGLADEGALFAGSGLAGWRELSVSELVDRLLAFARRGFHFVERQTVAGLLAELGEGEQSLEGLMQGLRHRAKPYLALLTDPPNVLEVMFLDDWQRLADDAGIDLARVTVFPSHNPYRLSCLQFGYPVGIESLAAAGYWRHAYERRADRAALHCVRPGPESYKAAGGL